MIGHIYECLDNVCAEFILIKSAVKLVKDGNGFYYTLSVDGW